MQENLDILTAFDSLLKIHLNKKTPEVFSQVRIIYFLGKILKIDLKDYFSKHLIEITACFKEMDIIARDEKTRIELRNFLCLIQEAFQLYHVEILLNDKNYYDISHPWEKCSQDNTHTEDALSYLFGPEDNQGYGYGYQIGQCIQQSPSELTQRKQISFLLRFALPVLSRRLALNGIDAADFYRIICYIESLMVSIKPELSETEKKFIYRFYEACFIYQQKNLVSIFKKEEDFLETLKKLNENYPQGSLLKVQHLSLLLERFSKDFAKYTLSPEDLNRVLSITQEVFQEAVFSIDCTSAKEILSESRKDFSGFLDNRKHTVFKCQENSTTAVQKLLNLFLKNSLALLGEPPCKLGLLLLGSSSRYDRGPYSDLEVALLYEPFEKDSAKKHEVAHYIATLIALLEIQVVFLGESHPENQGFWLDGSTSVRCHAYLRADVEGIIKKGLREKERHDKMPVPKEQNPRNLKLHSFLYDPSAYSLVQPLLVNTECGGAELFGDYIRALKAYLDETPNELLAKEFFDLLHSGKLESIEVPRHLTKRKMIALWVWWDVLRCLPDHVNLSSGEIDLKKTFHKPIAYFAMGLRLYYNLPASNLENSFIEAVSKKILSPWLGQFLIQLLEWSIELRCRTHLQARRQVETIDIKKTFSPVEQKRTAVILRLFNLMEKAMRHYLKNIATIKIEFELDKIIADYFQASLQESQNKEDYENWFLDVNAYLLYTKGLLETHRYYYRQIPEAYRKDCLLSGKAYFESDKDTKYWRTEEDFWIKLWDAPLSDGSRTKHIQEKAVWHKMLSSLVTDDIPVSEKILKVSITSLTIGKHYLAPALVKHLLTNPWIDKNGKFADKKTHPNARKMPGNHLVIPWPPDSPQFYFKVYPEYPLVELFLNELTRRLGYYSPREADLWFWQCGDVSYPVLVSQAVAGQSLQTVLTQNLPLQLNAHAFSQSMVMSALSSQEDSKPDNSMVFYDPIDGPRICLIDADRWFVPAFKDTLLHAKDIVFCLAEMNAPVNALFREEFLSINPKDVLQAWVLAIESLGNQCIVTFGEKIEAYFSGFTRTAEKMTLLLPPLKFHAVRELFDQIQLLQDVLSVASSPPATHWTLLSKINSRLANHYRLAHEKKKKPLERFEYAAGHAYIRSKENYHEYFTSKIDFKTQMQDMWEGLPPHNKVKENWIRDIGIAKIQLLGFMETDQKIKEAQQALKEGNSERFKQLSLMNKEKILQALDWSELTSKTQRSLMTFLATQGHWLNIMINNCSEITDSDMQALLKKSPALKRLSLINCPQLSDNIWTALPEKDCLLTVIYLKQLPRMKYLGYVGRLLRYAEKCLILPNLQTLSIIECLNFAEVHIKAEILETLTLHKRKVKDDYYAVSISDFPVGWVELSILQTQSQSLKQVDLAAWGADNPWRLLMNENYTCQLEACHLNYKAFKGATLDREQSEVLSRVFALIAQCPVLLGIAWQDYFYSPAFIQQAVTSLSAIFETAQLKYSDISHERRKQLLQAARHLLADALAYEKLLFTVIQTLGMLVKDSEFTEKKAKINLDKYQLKQKKQGIDTISDPMIAQSLKNLENESTDEKIQIAILLGDAGDARVEVITALEKLLKDKDPDVNVQAAGAFIKLGKESPIIINLLISAMEDIDAAIRVRAAAQLGNIKEISTEIIKALINALKDPDSYPVRIQAAESLEKIVKTLKAQIAQRFNQFNTENVLPLKEQAEIINVRENYQGGGLFRVKRINLNASQTNTQTTQNSPDNTFT